MGIEEKSEPQPDSNLGKVPQSTEPVLPKLRPATIDDYDRWMAGYLRTFPRVGLERDVHGEQSYVDRMKHKRVSVAESDFNAAKREEGSGSTIIIVPKSVEFSGDEKQFSYSGLFTLLIEGDDGNGKKREYRIVGDPSQVAIFSDLPSCKELFAKLRAENFGRSLSYGYKEAE